MYTTLVVKRIYLERKLLIQPDWKDLDIVMLSCPRHITVAMNVHYTWFRLDPNGTCDRDT